MKAMSIARKVNATVDSHMLIIFVVMSSGLMVFMVSVFGKLWKKAKVNAGSGMAQ